MRFTRKRSWAVFAGRKCSIRKTQMANLYSRLFKYRDRPSSSPTENFLTEGLADLLQRFPSDLQQKFIIAMLPDVCHLQATEHITAGKNITFITQFPIAVESSTKLPDMVVLIDERPFALFEIKIGAAEQRHTLRGDPGSERSLDDGSQKEQEEKALIQGQLKTYSDWIGSQNTGEWPGAVIFLTHNTPTPTGFDDDGLTRRTIHAIRMWRDVCNWLTDQLDLKRTDKTYCALAHDYRDFLVENGLMTEFVASRDLAATELFMPSYMALHHTLASVAKSVLSKYPKSKGGNLHIEFWSEGGVFWSWYYLNRNFNLKDSRFYIAFGVSFPEVGTFGNEDEGKLPRHEPFFFIILADDYENKKASELLTGVPEGWIQISEEYEIVVVRPVSKFEADPDIRARAVMSWAQAEVGRLVALINGFENAPIQEINEEEPA